MTISNFFTRHFHSGSYFLIQQWINIPTKQVSQDAVVHVKQDLVGVVFPYSGLKTVVSIENLSYNLNSD